MVQGFLQWQDRLLLEGVFTMIKEPNIKPQFKQFAINYSGKAQGNCVEAARLSGYSEKYATKCSHKLLVRSDVQAYLKYLAEVGETTSEDHIATISEIQAFWTSVMQNPGNELKDRLRAAELLAKAKGAFNNSEW